MTRISLISKFATCELSGHALLDDERYFDFLVDAGVDFRLYTSRYSADRILAKRPEGHRHIASIENTNIDIAPGSRVVFLGFSEPDVLAFLARNLLRRPRLVLVATNNFSKGRVERRRWILKMFFRLVRPFLDRLVLHTNHEQQLVAGLDRRAAAKSVVKKHHLMTPCGAGGGDDDADDAPVISYFGPEKVDKPIEPFLQLVEADIEQRFVYRIYNVGRAALATRLSDIDRRSNVEVVEGWQSQGDYLESVKRSKLLFLTHNEAFEGKLSGNLCDCFALRVPYIARAMEPMTSYHASYGPLGYLVDLNDSSWARRFLDDFDAAAHARMRANLARLGEDHTAEAIDSNLAACLLR